MATVQEFTLLQKSAITDIQADLEAAVEADRIAAQAAASTATTKANESAASSVKASQWAENNENVAVETGKFSAKHYSLKAAAQNAQMQAVYPTAAYRSRVLTDSGSIQDLSKLTELYIKNLQLLDSTVFLWSGVAGMKTRTSGSNQFASKLYNMANKIQQFGAELVTNGTFTTDTTGWASSGGATLSVDTARLKVTNTAGTNGGATQAITTVVGKTYHLTYAFTLGAGNGQVRVGTTLGGSQLLLSPVLSATTTRTVSFVATGTITYLFFGCDSLVITDFALYDNISVKQMDWIEGTNDAVQTTEANQPYVGGVIAPNEVRKIKNIIDNETLPLQTPLVLSSTGNSSFSITTVLRPYFMSIGSSSNKGKVTQGFEMFYDNVGRISIYNAGTGTIVTSGFDGRRTQGNTIITMVFSSSGAQFVINGVTYGYNGTYTPFTATFSGLLDNGSDDAFAGEIPHFQIHNRALSASEIQAQHDYLRLQIPEIEGVAIGNQYWLTSNYEVVVTGDGSVIPEVQNSDNVNRITNGTFTGGLAPWSASNANVAWQLGSGDGEVVINGTGTTNALSQPGLTVIPQGSWVLLKYRVVSNTLNAGTLITGAFSGSEIIIGPILLTSTVGSHVRAIQATQAGTALFLYLQNTSTSGSIIIDDVSFETVGWSQSTALYDAVYAQTTGTAAQKELAALKAAAMWCYYNNDVNNGAIYGKLYNWHAVKLISLYPPQGWRVPTSADFTQLSNYLGGSTVAGGKIKKEGIAYWNTGNLGTNESGFSGIGAGYRDTNFTAINLTNRFWTSTAFSATASYIALLNHNSDTFDLSSNRVNYIGNPLRLLRNSPVGPNERTITSTTIVSDIASTANSTQIPFGYSVASIRLKTTANLTNIKVELWNNFYSGTPALVATLITGKTANNTTMVFPVLADAPALLQDGTLRITATGANAFETVVEYNLQKNTF